MIIVKLTGGLGNQMFQYAAARSLACRHHAMVKVDISFLDGTGKDCTPRTYELKHLKVNAAFASAREIAEFTGQGKDLFHSLLSRFPRLAGIRRFHQKVYKEPHFHFDQAFINAPDNIYMEGYWQSEKYFQNIKEIITREFSVKDPLCGENLRLANLIQATNSVSVHVRRGDYVNNKTVNEIHGICGLDYYHRCFNEIVKRVADPHFFVFSDDTAWVHTNMRLPHPTTLVTHNGTEKGHEDLRLMGLCRHNIIANSSFGWWGAWLAGDHDSMTIAPKQWFKDRTINTRDLYPNNWIRL